MTTGATSSSAVGLVENPYCATPEAVIDELGSDRERGLSQVEVDRRLQQHGRNEIAAEKPPSMVAVALAQVRDPMNLMLIVVTLVSIAIGEVSTGVIVGLLIVLN
ncbi:MAG TPA: cation-transporting P-type ATPase, partial [Microlunatus sp.]|nr:cation-transporting P-type ATPase [Microlunatus sp.]